MNTSLAAHFTECLECEVLSNVATYPVDCFICGKRLNNNVGYHGRRPCNWVAERYDNIPFRRNHQEGHVPVCVQCDNDIRNRRYEQYVTDPEQELKKAIEDFKRRVGRNV